MRWGQLRMNFYLLLVLMTIIGAYAALYFKKAAILKNMKVMLRDYNIYAGGILYLIAAVINIYLLKYLDYSVVLPFTALTYLWTMLLSRIFLKETLSRKKINGMLLVIAGVVIIALSS